MRKLPLILVLAAVLTVALALPAGATAPTDVEFDVETSFVLLGPAPFEASGPAVDNGLMCGTGTVADLTGKAEGFTRNGFNFQGIKHFTCDDKSGEFLISVRARIDFRKGVTFNWNVLSGTGDYTDLHGAGSGVGVPGDPCDNPDECVRDLYDGGLHIH